MQRAGWSLVSVALYSLGSAVALSNPLDFGAYAVSDHRPCGLSNLPATTRELDVLFSSEEFERRYSRNFYWSNTRVSRQDWLQGADFTSHVGSANGFTGVDASAISYIASHGKTHDGVYSASMGLDTDDGCRAKSSDMVLGDNNARYLVLSTCQGLKIGTGENPNAPGENPAVTWSAERVSGLNCIFGYSNNIADADGYGKRFLQYMDQNPEETVADSFMRAGRSIASFNIPAVMCFGATEHEAEERLTGTRELSDEASGGGASVYTFETRRMVRDQKATVAPASVLRVSVTPKPLMLAVTKKIGRGIFVDHRRGTASYRRLAAGQTTLFELSDEQVMAIARKFVRDDLKVSESIHVKSIVDRSFARGTEQPHVIGKTVVFAQDVAGFDPLGNAGTIEVYIDSQNSVAAFHYALKNIEGSPGLSSKQVLTPEKLASNARSVLNMFKARYPQAETVELYSQQVGFDLGADVESVRNAGLTQQVAVEIKQGGYARRFVEAVPLN